MSHTFMRGGGSRLHRLLALAVVCAMTAVIAACGSDDPTGGAGGSSESGSSGSSGSSTPSYYPAEYKDIVAASKKEGGTLSIYSNTDQENWQPIFDAFQAQHPWVKKIAANNLDSDEVFQRYLSEKATGDSPADMLVTNATQAWAGFAKRSGVLVDYTSPELSKLPSFAAPLPNVYAFSTDPAGIVYNTSLVKDDITGFSSLADAVTKAPDKFKGKLTTRAVDGSYGFSVSYPYATERPDAWGKLQKALPAGRPEDSSGTQLEKITSGEYVAGFFISAAPAYPAADKSSGLIKVVLPDDGTPVLLRGIAIAATAHHPATAKLFLDFVLSQKGQEAVAKGGLTAYREGIQVDDPKRTYQGLVDEVGEDNVILSKYEDVPKADQTAFVKRWNSLLGSAVR